MQLSEINPVLTNTMGWDTQSAQNEEMVTFVKRATVFSEVTLPKSEFIKMQNDSDHFYEEIEPKMITDEVMKDYGNDFNQYVVFEGDISSMTDDVVQMCDFEWNWTINGVKITKANFTL
jgi:hypothetical protein